MYFNFSIFQKYEFSSEKNNKNTKINVVFFGHRIILDKNDLIDTIHIRSYIIEIVGKVGEVE